MEFILASKSPRRKEILSNLGYKFDVITSDTDENSTASFPNELVIQLAKRKAAAVQKEVENNKKIIIACDTVVALENKIFGKPKDKIQARNMLNELSGNKHSVYSGLCLIYKDKILTDYCKTDVYFDKLSNEEIEHYLDTNEWCDKAGGYGIQGAAGVFIKKIDGDYFNVVGLPVNLFYNMLKQL